MDRTRRQDEELPRKRLAALAEELRASSKADARDGPTVVFTSAEDSDENGISPPARRRLGRLVERWVPGGRAPGRRPALLVLSSVAALAGVAAAVGLWWQRPSVERPPELPVAADRSAPSPVARTGERLVVNVIGEVPAPGLVTVTSGARVADAVQAAGGLNSGAQLQGLNLARKVADGEQIAVGVSVPAGQPPPGGASGDQKLDLNTATEQEFDGLPGVGPVTAQRIVERRTRHGPFASVEQLREVEGIGEAKLARLAELVRV